MRAALLALPLMHVLASEAAAQSVRAALDVEAEPACATVEGVSARVRARSSRIALEAGAPITLRVAIARQASDALSAELEVGWPDGRRSTRALKAQSCAAAVDAIAFLITLSLDPSSASDAEASDVAPAPKRTADAPPSAETPSVEPQTDAQTNAPAPAPAPADSAPRPAPVPPEPSASTQDEGAQPAELRFAYAALGLAAHGVLGPAPRFMPGAALLAQLGWDGPLPWSPLVQLRLGRSWLDTERAGGTAHFRLDAAQLSVCPLGLRASGLTAHACGVFEIGSLRARGTETYDPQAHARLWLSGGAELLLSARLFGPVALQLGAGLSWPLRRDRFAFAPAVFHRVASTLLEAHAGLAVRFP